MKKKRTRTERLQEILEGVMSLLVLFLMLAASVVYMGKLLGHSLTEPLERKEVSIQPPSSDILVQLGLSDDATLEERDIALWTVISSTGETQGTIVNTTRIGENVHGYAGATPLYVYIGKNDQVVAIVAQQNSETPDFFEEAKGVLNKWIGTSVSEGMVKNTDAISGATLSSKALNENVRLALKTYAQTDTNTPMREPGIGWLKASVAICVMLLGAFVHLYRKGKKRWRIVVLSLNVLVLGFWTGQFLSLGMLRNWVANGFDWLTILPALFMLLLTLGLAFFGHKHHHCIWVCPYGSIQDLAYRLPLPKIKVKPLAMQRLRRLRQVILLLLFFLSWVGIGVEGLLDYEPFSAFLVTVAAPGTLILAGGFLVVSMFVPQVWCRGFCPVGEVLDLAYDMRLPSKSKKKNLLTNSNSPEYEQV